MNNSFKLVKIDSKYCDYLRQFDDKVPYNKDKKELRPFVGILFQIHDCEYFAPLTSPKPKHLKMKNTLDFFKIDDGKLGAINFNNMLPVMNQNYSIITFDSDKKYNELLLHQLEWLNENHRQIRKTSRTLYNLYNSDNLIPSIKNRCCNFKLLEEKCSMYNQISA